MASRGVCSSTSIGADSEVNPRQRWRMCYCGRAAPLVTLWIEKNSRRRFFGCASFPQGRCGILA
ncbi:Zinc finger, GRF-type [Senna tora]|uniref:Zinc finger, GRF-type n=1 Tax=Senna tora TaxID=362788 RepID=A0A834T8U9_9FABA|nr:Zinc finger, GRF-type [Senna tora]